MKKVIPQKVANKVYILSQPKNQRRLRIANDWWIKEKAYRPGTKEISNRLFKNSVGFLSLVDRRYKPQGDLKRYKLHKLLIESREKINDYLQEK